VKKAIREQFTSCIEARPCAKLQLRAEIYVQQRQNCTSLGDAPHNFHRGMRFWNDLRRRVLARAKVRPIDLIVLSSQSLLT